MYLLARRKKKHMTNTFKRRLYRLSLAGATCFLFGLLVYDLGDLGVDTLQLYWVCYFLVIAGIILCFKTLQVWSVWEEDKSEDPDEERHVRDSLPVIFYVEAAAMSLVAVFLLVWTMLASEPDSQGYLVFTLGLLVIGGCVLMGHLSSNLGR